MTKIGIISPQDWGLPALDASVERDIPALGISTSEVNRRIASNLQEWLPRQLDPDSQAFYGFYRAPDGFREPPQTVNLIAAWQLMAAYDRFGESSRLDSARRVLDFYYRKFVVSHPMSTVRGGARDGVAVNEIWTKFSAEFAIGALGYYQRSASSYQAGSPAEVSRISAASTTLPQESQPKSGATQVLASRR